MRLLKLLIIITSIVSICYADTIVSTKRYITGNAAVMKSLDTVYGVHWVKYEENKIDTDNYYSEVSTSGIYKAGKTKTSIDLAAKYQAGTIKTKDIAGSDLVVYIKDIEGKIPTKGKEIK